MRSRSPQPRGLLLSGLLFLSLAACATTTGSGGPTEPAPRATFCAAAKPIYWSARDTDATIAAVKAHNAAWAGLCEAEG